MDITMIIEAVNSANETASTFADASTAVVGDLGKMGAFLGAALAMVGGVGVGAGQGYAAGAAALAVSRNPDAKSSIMSTMIVGMAIAESAAIYSLIVAILLIFVAN